MQKLVDFVKQSCKNYPQDLVDKQKQKLVLHCGIKDCSDQIRKILATYPKQHFIDIFKTHQKLQEEGYWFHSRYDPAKKTFSKFLKKVVKSDDKNYLNISYKRY